MHYDIIPQTSTFLHPISLCHTCLQNIKMWWRGSVGVAGLGRAGGRGWMAVVVVVVVLLHDGVRTHSSMAVR
jgi:hypothetical protein